MDLPGMVGALPCDVDLDAAPVLSTPPVAGIYRCSRSYPQNPHHWTVPSLVDTQVVEFS